MKNTIVKVIKFNALGSKYKKEKNALFRIFLK